MKITNIPKKKSTYNTTKKRRVCVYARVSTQYLDQATSIDKQIEVYTNKIKNNSNEVFVGVYLDHGKSGTTTANRTGFNRMLQDCKEGKIDHIMTKSISRFARNTLDTLSLTKGLKEMGVTIYFEKENIDTSTVYSDLLLSIYASFAEEESRSISKNVTWGMRKWMAKGNTKIPFKAFLGYDKGFVINEEQAKIVKLIFYLFINGNSYGDIKRHLENNHIPTATSLYTWHTSVIMSILKNEKYIGDVYSQKTYKEDVLDKRRHKNNQVIDSYYVEHHHEAIIDKLTYNLTQIKILYLEQKISINIVDHLDELLTEEECNLLKTCNFYQIEEPLKLAIKTKIIDYIK